MTVIHGHFDGRQIVLDEPVPADVRAQTEVRVLFEEDDARIVLAEIAQLAVATDELPKDYSEQHEHYVKGTPRR